MHINITIQYIQLCYSFLNSLKIKNIFKKNRESRIARCEKKMQKYQRIFYNIILILSVLYSLMKHIFLVIKSMLWPNYKAHATQNLIDQW